MCRSLSFSPSVMQTLSLLVKTMLPSRTQVLLACVSSISLVCEGLDSSFLFLLGGDSGVLLVARVASISLFTLFTSFALL